MLKFEFIIKLRNILFNLIERMRVLLRGWFIIQFMLDLQSEFAVMDNALITCIRLQRKLPFV